MKKRNVTFVGPEGKNFLGYELDENGTLKCKASFGCRFDWIDLLPVSSFSTLSSITIKARAHIFFFYNESAAIMSICFDFGAISLKCSAFNNLALAKNLHHFYNTRVSEIRIDLMEKHLVTAVRDLLKRYKSTTQLAIFRPRDHGGLGVKKLSFVHYTTRIAFLVKMLNHDVEKFPFIARESLKLDMKKRNVTFVGPEGKNFLGYELDENGTLKCKASFGCRFDWVDLLRYTRKIAVNLEY